MTLTREEAVDRARTLAPGIAERARETEELRRPHDDNIKELIDAGLMELLTPKRWGGHELDLDTHRQVVETISAACASTGWVLAFYIGHNVFATRFSPQAQEEFFADKPYILAPATTSPTTRAERVDGGWIVSGTVPWGSGIMHADWTMCTGLGSDGKAYSFALPFADVSIGDVWHMAGMAGTGSNDIVIDKAFVPDHRALPAAELTSGATEGAALHTNPLYHIPLLPFVFCEALPVFSGALRGAAGSFEEITRRRVTTHTGSAAKENKYGQIKLGEALINARIAERLVADQVRQTVELSGGEFTLDDRVQLKGQAAAIVQHCRNAVLDMAHNGGSSNFALDVPLQRIFRDISVIATHAFWNWETSREVVGRNTLGLPPTTPLV